MLRGELRSADLPAVISSLAARRVRIGEIITALDVGRSTYYQQRDEGRLVSADNLLRLASELDLNPIELLLHCGLVGPEVIVDCAGKIGADRREAGTDRTPRNRRFQRRLDAPPL